MRSLIDMARDRNAYIDQSQSLNLFAESPNIGKLISHVHVRLEEGAEDDLLSALASRHAHCEDHSASCFCAAACCCRNALRHASSCVLLA